MQNENLRWMLVVAGIGILAIFQWSNNQKGQAWERTEPIDVNHSESAATQEFVYHEPAADTPAVNGTIVPARELPSMETPELVAMNMPSATLAIPPMIQESEPVGQELSFEGPEDIRESSGDNQSNMISFLPPAEEETAEAPSQTGPKFIKNPLFDEVAKEQMVEQELLLEKLPEPTPMKIAEVEVQRQPQTIQRYNIPRPVEVRAVHHVEYGKSLARRGALFAAQQELYSALRIVAQAIDIQVGNQEYSEGLGAAFIAMKEAEDFYRHQVNVENMVDVKFLCQSHRTKILSPADMARLSPAQAMQSYYAYAQQLMVRCAGNSVVASEALYCLGRLFSMKAQTDLSGSSLNLARAIVHHQAAVEVDPNNYRSANEVGVLLSRTGQLERAVSMFKRSLRIQQTPKTWQNLAQIHRRMAESNVPTVRQENLQLAEMAEVEYQRMLAGPTSAVSSIQWVTPKQFAEMPGGELPVRTADSAVQEIENTSAEKKAGIVDRVKSWF